MAKNRNELPIRQKAQPRHKLEKTIEAMPPCRDFRAALSRPERINILAELKKASPSRGIIRADFDPGTLAPALALNGAAALSVLTEQYYFKGHIDYLRKAAALVQIPVLRKDFIFDEYQVAEARACGADAILLIAAALDDKTLVKLVKCASKYGLAVLAEAHNQPEIKRCVAAGANIIGINCRDLRNFTTNLELIMEMLELIPENCVKVAESGIKNHEDILKLKAAGADAFLIGESLMRQPEPGQYLKKMIEETQKA